MTFSKNNHFDPEHPLVKKVKQMIEEINQELEEKEAADKKKDSKGEEFPENSEVLVNPQVLPDGTLVPTPENVPFDPEQDQQ